MERAYAPWVPEIGGRPRPMDDDYAVVLAEREGWVEAAADGLRAVIVLWPEDGYLWVDNVAVDPAAQGEGLGRELLRLAERRAAELGMSELRLLTHELMASNRELYGRLGWSEFEPEDREHDFLTYFRKPASA